MFKRSKPEVLVVGAGPVGLFAALWLARLGVKPQIIDEEKWSASRSYALALHPGSLELLEELGLVEEILSHARRVAGMGLYEGSERHGQIDFSALPGRFPFVAIMAQSRLERILAQALEAENVKIHWNHRLANLSLGPESVAVQVDTLQKESMGYATTHMETVITDSGEMEVPLVLAADGHESLVRRQLGIGFDTVKPAQHFAVVEFTPSEPLPDEARIVMDDETTNVLWPMPDGRYRWSFQLTDIAPSESREKDRLLVPIGAEDFPQLEASKVDELITLRAPWFHGKIAQTHWRILVRFEHRLASSFGKSRVWLAGDAAHMTGPVGVQSMNLGLREAARLCNAYASILHGDLTLDSLATYGEERLAAWRFLLGVGAGLRTRGQATPWLEKRAARLLPCIPASGDYLERVLQQLGLEVTRASDAPE